MTTPICDFVRAYSDKKSLRLHMPGHKGVNSVMGVEALDITEIEGADCLYCADGIIAESQANAGRLFGAHTFYSTEGSSLCIRAMLLLAVRRAAELGIKPLIMAARNAHRTFLSAAALLDLDLLWIEREQNEGYLCCIPSATEIDELLAAAVQKPVAVYLTSPDYLGNVCDIGAVADVCHKHGVMLLVDNAHGAYLKFLQEPCHPIDMGADMCCDSAHKTLYALTGTAYLHISENAPRSLVAGAPSAMLAFGSTSPSYLLLQSLDALNVLLDGEYRERLANVVAMVAACKKRLSEAGYTVIGSEPLKLTIAPKSYGYEGVELASLLLQNDVVCEFADRDYTVMMFTPEISSGQIQALGDILCSIPKLASILQAAPSIPHCERVISPREALFAASELLPVENCIGRILAEPSVSCPPAVPILVCGERITIEAARCFEYYGVKSCFVVKE